MEIITGPEPSLIVFACSKIIFILKMVDKVSVDLMLHFPRVVQTVPAKYLHVY